MRWFDSVNHHHLKLPELSRAPRKELPALIIRQSGRFCCRDRPCDAEEVHTLWGEILYGKLDSFPCTQFYEPRKTGNNR